MLPEKLHRLLVPLLLLCPFWANAQNSPFNEIEVGGLAYQYDQDIAPWRGMTVRTQFGQSSTALWRGEAVIEQRFNEPSFGYKLEHSRATGNWITRIAGRTTNGGFYNPIYRFDGQLGYKLGPSRKFVVLVGGFYQAVRDGHRDYAGILESQVYLGSNIVLQAGTRLQRSTPGDAWSQYHDAAVTIGRAGKRYVTVRGAFGSEAYAIIDPLVIYTDFKSAVGTVTWREWTARDWGFTVSASMYENPFYRRVGFQVGIFHAFGSAR